MPTFTSQPTNLWTLDAKQLPYEFNSCRIIIEGSMGNALMPVAAPQILGPSGTFILPTITTIGLITTITPAPPRVTAEICQTVAPYGRRVVQWASQRLGFPPIVPHPDPQDPNQILADYRIQMDPPLLQEDGVNHIYRLAATYVYHLLQPIWLLDGLIMGATPYDITPCPDNVFSASFFQYGLQSVNPLLGGGGSGEIGAEAFKVQGS